MVVDLFVHILCIRTFICESNDLAHQSTQKIMIASQKYSDRWREHNKHNTQKKRGSQLFDTRRLNAIKQQQKSFHPYAIRIFKKKNGFFFSFVSFNWIDLKCEYKRNIQHENIEWELLLCFHFANTKTVYILSKWFKKESSSMCVLNFSRFSKW